MQHNPPTMEAQLEQLSLSNDEEGELWIESIVAKNTVQQIDLCLVGRFLSDRMINVNAMKHRSSTALNMTGLSSNSTTWLI